MFQVFTGLGRCNLCGHDRFKKVADKLRDTSDYKVYKCMSCGHVQLLPRPTASENKRFYDEDRQEKTIRKKVNLENLRTNFRHDIRRRVEFMRNRFPKNKMILDLGCGYGFFLEEMAQLGYKIKGIEISKERRELAKKVTNIPIFDINVAEPNVRVTIEPVDVVTLFHVLEHIAYPITFCKNIKQKLLKKGGCLVVEVPNVNELMLKACPAYNEFYWNRAHLNYFSEETLKKVLEKAGYKEIEITYIQRYGIENLCNWLITGKPQLEKPVFEIIDPYKWLENYYRKYLGATGRADTIFAAAFSDSGGGECLI
jgi:2-polyprenyl-3-methyl-5-hydroxy-6-metoxy-1,4-benzoquinol methylase